MNFIHEKNRRANHKKMPEAARSAVIFGVKFANMQMSSVSVGGVPISYAFRMSSGSVSGCYCELEINSL